jgi:hypothetical protein
MPTHIMHGSFGYAWLALCVALVAHVADEALTNFLGVYNPTVLAMRARYPWFPMPTFRFGVWLSGLIAACVLLLLLTPFAFRPDSAGGLWLRPGAYIFAFIMLFNGLGHVVFTIFGRTVSSVHFSRPAPGFYSSPFMLAASIYLLVRLLS